MDGQSIESLIIREWKTYKVNQRIKLKEVDDNWCNISMSFIFLRNVSSFLSNS